MYGQMRIQPTGQMKRHSNKNQTGQPGWWPTKRSLFPMKYVFGHLPGKGGKNIASLKIPNMTSWRTTLMCIFVVSIKGTMCQIHFRSLMFKSVKYHKPAYLHLGYPQPALPSAYNQPQYFGCRIARYFRPIWSYQITIDKCELIWTDC